MDHTLTVFYSLDKSIPKPGYPAQVQSGGARGLPSLYRFPDSDLGVPRSLI